ncbi:MAG: DUF1475 family protein [Candidatus Sumerlaeia bacterium]|nr:DUF1475 family protein [Candidatus Sumerlaeia bacterium]
MLCTVRHGISLLFALLLGFIVHASFQSALWDEGGVLMDYAWFRTTLVDLYAGLILAGVWVFHRESNRVVAGLWTLSFFLLGNLSVLAYVWIHLMRVRRREDLAQFFQGHRAPALDSKG